MLALALKPIDLTFQEHGHVHILNGMAVPGCTSISGLFQDDGWKFAWPVKLMEKEVVREVNRLIREQGDEGLCNGQIEDICAIAKHAWRKARDGAAAKGTSAHEYVEDYVKHGVKIPPTAGEEVRHCFNEFIKWEEKYSPIWLATELQVGSELHKYAGILDALCEIDGHRVLLDYKTSKSIKADYNIQLAGLTMALEEMGCHVDQRAILHLPKELDKEYEYRIIESDLELDKRAFLAGLEFYRHKNIFMARTK